VVGAGREAAVAARGLPGVGRRFEVDILLCIEDEEAEVRPVEQEKVWREFMALSAEDQRRVANLIASLRAKSRPALSDGPEKRPNLTDEPFVGMWREREDMRDSDAWLREAREREWMRPHG
jgi:hypothetical protein